MKHTFTVKESRELPSAIRPSLHNLYFPYSPPNLFNLPPNCLLYTGWLGNHLMAAIKVDFRDLLDGRQIRITDVACKNASMLRELIEKVLHQLNPYGQHKTTVSLTLRDQPSLLGIDSFIAIGFRLHLEATVYELFPLPFHKDQHARWKLCLEYPETYASWLSTRNQYAQLLPGALPLTARAMAESHQRQGVFHFLKRDGIVVGTMHSRIELSRLHIYEFHMTSDMSTVREGISFLQQSSYIKLGQIEDIFITTTSCQSTVREMLLKQYALKTSSISFTLLKDLAPRPYFQ